MSSDLLGDSGGWDSEPSGGVRGSRNDGVDAQYTPQRDHQASDQADLNPWANADSLNNEAVSRPFGNHISRSLETQNFGDDWGDFENVHSSGAQKTEALPVRSSERSREHENNLDPWDGINSFATPEASAIESITEETKLTPIQLPLVKEPESWQPEKSETVKPSTSRDPWSGFDTFETTPKSPAVIVVTENGEHARPWKAKNPEVLSSKPAEPSNGPGPAHDSWSGFDNFEVKSSRQFDERLPAPKAVQPIAEGLSQPSYFPRPQALWETRRSMSSPKPSRSQGPSPRPPRDENVIFDAEDLSESEDEDEAGEQKHEEEEVDDDFGEFQDSHILSPALQIYSVSVPKVKVQVEPHSSLIDFDEEMEAPVDTPPSSKTINRPIARNSNETFDPFGGLDDAFGVLEASTPAMRFGSSGIFGSNSADLALPMRPRSSPAKTGSRTQHNMSAHEDKSNARERQTVQTHKSGAFVRPEVQRERAQNSIIDDSGAPDDQEWDSFAESTTLTNHDVSGWGDWEEPQHNNDNVFPPGATDDPPLLKLPILLHSSPSTSAVAPTNVPPPALLLPLFPPILATVKADLLDSSTDPSQPHETRNMILTHPVTVDFLKKYLSIATVLARVIAGRKLRWKRDTVLTQSMRIGPASSGRASGMKLTSLDKGENVREEREVSNVLRQWRLQLGKLRAAVTGAGIDSTIPDVSDMLPVRMAQPSEGAIVAPKPCALCSLKRNERVQKVDINVEDGFGEWWVDHWGHRACKDFWVGQERNLPSR